MCKVHYVYKSLTWLAYKPVAQNYQLIATSFNRNIVCENVLCDEALRGHSNNTSQCFALVSGHVARHESRYKSGLMKLTRQSDSDYEERSADKENGADKPAKSKSHGLKSMSVVAKSAAQKFSPKTVRKKHKASVAVMKVYPSELVCNKPACF